ncbi:MAG: O-antigen ligase family protein [Bacilli bacterium]|nr:O-antigen ligase family protein [Bacilli bacterium]
MNKTIKFNKKFDTFIYLFLLFSPLLDALTSIFVRNTNLGFSIGTIFRGVFLLLVILWIRVNVKNKKILVFFILYVLLALMYFFGTYRGNILPEITNLFQIFYLPIMLLFFSKYNNDKIDDKLMVKIYLFYLNLILIPYLFNLGYSLTESYSNKVGYFGLFIGGNEISGILVGLAPIVLTYVVNSKNYILKIVVYIELLFAMILVGTKTLFLGIIITILYLIYRRLRYAYVVMNEKSSKLPYLLGIPILIVIIILFPRLPMIKNINTTLKYYNINKVSDVFKIENIDNIVFSKRLSNLSKVNKKYFKGETQDIIYGLGFSRIYSMHVIEIDVFDIFYSIGIFGTFVYFLLILYTVKFNGLRDNKAVACSLFILMSLFTGHILTKPMVSIYIALLYLLSRNSITLNKKKVLLVSNMYPSDKYKHYGVFVKNTEEILKNNGYDVDRVVMTKQTEKLAKLFSYIYLYSMTLLKGIFNNYDYLYVHFVSHSSLGAVMVKRTSKNTKLILNAHGNDVQADMPFELKNEKRSSKYFKYADKVIVPSNYYKGVINEKYKVNEDSIYVYPSGGVDTSKFKKIDQKEAKKEAGLKEEYSYIGYVSRIEFNKGYDIFLKAIKELVDEKKIKNERFIVVGGGQEEDKFNELVKKLNIKDYLEIRNMVSQEELINIYNSLDIFVFPTYRKSESLGLVGLEAMACETLVIASKNYGPTDYVINNKNGKFFKPEDYKDLAKKILEMKKLNNEEIKKMKKKARETAVKYDSKNTKDMILKVFK